jgi:hypothetical protein
METRVTRALASYNLLSKSVPGVVLAVLGVLLLPSGLAFFPLDFGDTLADYAVTLLAGLLFGLFLGEGVHTAAIVTERGMVWAGRVVKSTIRGGFVRSKLIWVWANRRIVPGFILKTFNNLRGHLLMIAVIPLLPVLAVSWPVAYIVLRFSDGEMGSVLDELYSVTLHVVEGTWTWVTSRYGEVQDTLKSHRLLFARSLITNYSKSNNLKDVGGRWEYREKGHPYDCFKQCVKHEFGENISLPEGASLQFEEELQSLYPLIKSELSRDDRGMSDRFQTIYSFCRSMYVVCGVATAVFLVVLYPSLFPRAFSIPGVTACVEPLYSSPLTDAVPRPVRWVVPSVSSLAFGVFFYGTGNYKRYFVSYFITDFCQQNRHRLPADSQYHRETDGESTDNPVADGRVVVPDRRFN